MCLEHKIVARIFGHCSMFTTEHFYCKYVNVNKEFFNFSEIYTKPHEKYTNILMYLNREIR